MQLRKQTLEELTAKGVTVRDFTGTLMTLPHAIAFEHESFIKTEYKHIKEAETIEEIFYLHLNFHLTFIDFGLLEHIINQYGSPGLRKLMKRYSQDLQLFKSETTIKQVLPHLRQKSTSPKCFSKLESIFNINVDTSTLEDLDEQRKRLASEISLSQAALKLFDFRESSLLVTWLVPIDLLSFLREQILQKDPHIFAHLNILELSLNGDCLYSSTTQVLYAIFLHVNIMIL